MLLKLLCIKTFFQIIVQFLICCEHLVTVSTEEINTASQYCDITVYTQHMLSSFSQPTRISNHFLQASFVTLGVRPGLLVVWFHIYSFMTAGCQQITGLSCDCARGVEYWLPTILIKLKTQEFYPPMICLLPMYLNLRGTGCLYVTP